MECDSTMEWSLQNQDKTGKGFTGPAEGQASCSCCDKDCSSGLVTKTGSPALVCLCQL